MMRVRFVALSVVLACLASCGPSEEATTNSANDFASRVGTAQGGTPGGSDRTMATEAAQGGPPVDAEVKILDEVGFIGGVDLGKRAGTCAFNAEGVDKLMATGPAETTMSSKAVVRIGGTLYRLDGEPGGFAAVRDGAVFRGEGVTVEVQPTVNGKAQLTVTDRKGQTKTLLGDWNC